MNKQSITKILLTFLISMMGANAFAADIAEQNADGVVIFYNYINDGKELEVVCKNQNGGGYEGNVVIPEEITYMDRTRKVTSIGEKAFYGCGGLTSVTIPNNVTSIGETAFYNCWGLTSVIIPNNVTSIGIDAFYGCRGLTSVTIGNSVKSIGNNAFNGCWNLTSVNIPSSVTSIGYQAFAGCNMTTVIIPNSVTSISSGTFYGCKSLTSVTIPNSVTSIGSTAFMYCSGLTSVTIPNSVTSIGNEAFESCDGLTSVTIPNSVAYIGEKAFQNCGRLTSVTIPNSLASISERAFFGCWSLTFVSIPNSVTSIGVRAFSGCDGLTTVTIPNSVTYIGNEAFYRCNKLTSIHISDVAAWCNIIFSDYVSNPLYYADHIYLNGEEVKDLIIPDGVISIGNYAFNCCNGLTSVTIPNSVTSIGNEAFSGVDIPTIISLIENPFPINGNSSNLSVFSNNTFKNATLYVPVGTIDKYKVIEGWKDFLFIEEGPGPNGGEEKKCATPTIGYQNGKLTFNCETEGVTCQYTITDDDVRSGSANELQLGVTYHISVYATKEGFDNSDIATATLCWIDVEPKTEGITNGVANVRALPLLIQSNGSTLTISGAVDGTPITVYSINGTEAGSAVSQNGTATISTALQSGSAAIVKVGNKSVKVVVK